MRSYVGLPTSAALGSWPVGQQGGAAMLAVDSIGLQIGITEPALLFVGERGPPTLSNGS